MAVEAKPQEKKKIANPPYLRKKGTDQIFAYSPILAEREDMEPWYQTMSDGNADKPDTSVNKITAIINVIGKLDSVNDFRKNDGTPKAPSLSREVGFDVNVEERDEAWAIYQRKINEKN